MTTMDDERFKEGDVVVGLDSLDKWVIWYEDKYCYRLKLCGGNETSETSSVADILYCNQNFVKVGRWDFRNGMEVEEDD